MTVLDDLAAECPPELRARLDDVVEVAPGVTKRLGACTMDDAAGYLEASHEAVLNHQETEKLLRAALEQGIEVPSVLLARLAAADDGPELIAVRNELRAVIAQASA
jgi:hypothetical protein